MLRSATVVKLSMDDARGVLGAEQPEDIFAALAGIDPLAVVLTDGPRRVWLKRRGDSGPLSVEPTGAGDAFTAALIARLVQRGWSAPDSTDLRYAAAAGALTTTRPGAHDELPTANELTAFLEDRTMAN